MDYVSGPGIAALRVLQSTSASVRPGSLLLVQLRNPSLTCQCRLQQSQTFWSLRMTVHANRTTHRAYVRNVNLEVHPALTPGRCQCGPGGITTKMVCMSVTAKPSTGTRTPQHNARQAPAASQTQIERQRRKRKQDKRGGTKSCMEHPCCGWAARALKPFRGIGVENTHSHRADHANQ